MTDFHAQMKAANVLALWELEGRHNYPIEPAYAWRWATMEPLVEAAIRATTMDNAERRVLVLNNPANAGSGMDCAASNLAVNLQVLMPGERARPHRHTMHALRFVLEGTGVTTIVEGKPCAMLPGDMILTPGMTWHEHVHAGDRRCVWVDALDVPFQRYMKTPIFEPGPVHDLVQLPPDSAFGGAGLSSAAPMTATPYSPLFRYPWETAVQALQALPASEDGSRRLRYTNPMTGGAVMATLDCYLLGLDQGRETAPRMTNANTVCVVVEGEGTSTIGEETMHWGKKDIFTLPRGRWTSHKAASANARLFQITDREILHRLDLLREETRH